MKRSSLIVIWMLAALAACTPSVPSEFIQPDDMEDILYDYYVAQAMLREDGSLRSSELNRTKYYLAVLKKYDVTEAEFDSSLVYYYGHVEDLKKIYSHVNERLSDDAKSLGVSVGDIGRYSQYSATGDTANIWKETAYVLLMPHPTANRFDFTVKADTSFFKGDSFMFQCFAEYLWQNGTKDAVVCIKSEYEGDSIIQSVSHISSGGTCQVRVPANNNGKLRKMTGYIYLGDGGDKGDTRRLMFVSQMQLIRFHNKQLINQNAETDTLKKDSLQRIDDPRRALPDSAGRGAIGRRTGGTPQLAPRRDSTHRVDLRKVELKKK